MAKYSNTIEYQLRTTLDDSGIAKLQSELTKLKQQLETISFQHGIPGTPQAIKDIEKVEQAIKKAYNPQLGILNYKIFNKSLEQAGTSMTKLYSSFATGGAQGIATFTSLYGQVNKFNTGLTQITKTTDKIFNTIGNTVRWGIVASGFQSVMNAARESVEYVKDLDRSLTDIMMVTEYSKQQMNEYAKSANEAAKALGSTTVAMTDATLVFAQQGFNLEQSDQLAQLSTKLANASQQDTATTSDQITAYMNAYGLDKNMEALNAAMDSWAEVANISAADVAELATASQKAASTAATVGVSMDQLNGQIAAIESVTREAPENIGNGLKTLYARFSDIGMGETLEDGVDLGQVTGTLEKVGVQVLNAEGQMNNVGDIMEDLMDVWGTLDQTQKAAIATTLAGKYQLARFEALMNRSDLYKEYKEGSENADGTLEIMNEKYIDSIQGKMNKLQATLEGVFNNLFNSTDFYGMIDGLTEVIDLFDKLTDSIGDTQTVLLGLGAVFGKLFSNQMAAGVSNMISNFGMRKQQDSNAKLIQQQAIANLNDKGLTFDESAGTDNQRLMSQYVNKVSGVNQFASIMTTEQSQQAAKAIEQYSAAVANSVLASEKLEQQLRAGKSALSLFGYQVEITEQELIGLKKDLEMAGAEGKTTAEIFQNNGLGNLIASVEEAQIGIFNFTEALQTAERTDADIDWDRTFDRAAQAIARLNRLASNNNIDSEIRKIAASLSQKLTKATDQANMSTEELRVNLVAAGSSFQGFRSELEAIGITGMQSADQLEQSALKSAQASAQVQGVADAMDKMRQQFSVQNVVTQVTNLASGLASLAFSYQTLKNIGNIMSDDSLTSMEKLEEIILNILTTLPMLGIGFTQTASALKLLNQTVQAFAITQLELLTTSDLLRGAEAAEVVSKTALIAITEQEIGSKKKLNIQQIKEIAGKSGLTAQTVAATLAQEGYNLTLGATITLLSPYIAAIIAVAAAITGIALAIKGAIDHYNRFNTAVEESEKNVKSWQESLSLAKQKVDELSSVKDKLQEIKDSFEGLTKGTDEWNESLLEANKNVLDLVNEIPELAQYLEKDKETGAWTVSQEGIDKVLSEKEQQESIQSAGTKISQNINLEAELDRDLSEKIRNGSFTEETGFGALNALRISSKGFIENYNEDAMIPILKEIAQDINNDSSILDSTDSVKKYAMQRINWQGTEEQYNQIWSETDFNLLREKLIELSQMFAENQAQIDGNLLALSQSVLMTNDAFNSASAFTQEYMSNFAEQTIAAGYGSGFNEYTNSADQYVDDLLQDKSYKTIKQEYANKNDYIQYNDGKLQRIDENGEVVEEEIKISVEEMKQELRGIYISELIDNQSASIKAAGDQVKAKWNGIVSDDFEILDDIFSFGADGQGIFDFGSLDFYSAEAWKNLFNTEELYDSFLNQIESTGIWEDMGYETAQAMMDDLERAYNESAKLGISTIGSEGRWTDYDEDELKELTKDYDPRVFQEMVDQQVEKSNGLYQYNQTIPNESIISQNQGLFGKKDNTFDPKKLNNLDIQPLDVKEMSVTADNLDEVTDKIERQKQAYEQAGKSTKSFSDTLEELNRIEKQVNKTATQIVAQNIATTKSVQSLASNWEKWSDTLNESPKGSQAYNEAMNELRAITADILDLDFSDIDESFVTDNLESIQALAEGDKAALDTLRDAATDEIVMNIDYTQGGAIDPYSAEVIKQNLIDVMDGIKSEVDTSLEIGADVDISEYIAKLNEMIEAGHITAQDATKTLSAAGFEGNLVTKEGTYHIPVTKTVTNVEENRNPLTGRLESRTETEEVYVDYKEVKGEYQVLEGGEYKGSGVQSIGNYTPYSSSSKSASGSGGSGGSEKTYTPKEKDPIEEEVDRYEKVNTELEKVSNEYDKVNSARNRLTGNKLAGAMQEEINLMHKQIDLHKEKLAIQKDEAKELRENLSTSFGITFDSEGFIDNYATTLKALEAEVNSILAQYANATSEEEEKALDEQLKVSEKRLEDFKKWYARYDELFGSEIPESEKALQDLEDGIEDVMIEAIQKSTEAIDSIKELKEAYIDFQRSLSDMGKLKWDDPFDNIKDSNARIANYFSQVGDDYEKYYQQMIDREQKTLDDENASESEKLAATRGKQYWQSRLEKARNGQGIGDTTGYLDMAAEDVDFYNQQIEQYEATGRSDYYGKNGAQLYEDAKEAANRYKELINGLSDEAKQLQDEIIAGIDAIGEALDERMEQFSNINDELEYLNELTELSQGDKAYEQKNNILAAQVHNSKTARDELLKTLEVQKGIMADLEAKGQQDTDEWKEANAKVVETQEKIRDYTKEILDYQKQIYDNTVNSSLDSWLNEALGTDLDWMSTQWELINRNADYYLDDVNAAYNIQKLQGRYLDMLDQSNDLKIQEQITAQMEAQLGYLRDKEKISEYDVAYANAQLELLQKRIALEEAQRNKSQMKLKRDSQGNYSYVYTANEGDVKNAQNELADAENNAYNLSKEQMTQTQSDALSALQKARDDFYNIMSDANLEEEEKAERIKMIADNLNEYLAGTAEQLSTSQVNIINDFLGMCELLTEENGARLNEAYEEIKNKNYDFFQNIDGNWSTALTSMLQNLKTFEANTSALLDKMNSAAHTWAESMKDYVKATGIDLENLTKPLKECKDETDKLHNSFDTFFTGLLNNVGTIQQGADTLAKLRTEINNTENDLSTANNRIKELEDKLVQAENDKRSTQAKLDAYESGSESSGSGSGSGNTGGDEDDYGGVSLEQAAMGIAGNIWNYNQYTSPTGSWGDDPTRHSLMNQIFGQARGDKLFNAVQALFGNFDGYGYKKPFPSGINYANYGPNAQWYDTGGYTGQWSDGDNDAKNGKLAYLHQKELVLNAHDTDNLLQVVNTVRDIVSNIKSGAVIDLINGISSLPIVSQSSQELQQQVQIDATFPNAESAAEIKEAILGLVDQASQYAYRR